MRMNRFTVGGPIRWMFALLALAVLASCASTQVVSSWKDTRYSGPPVSKAMVIAVTKQSAFRRILEDGFVAELRSRGVDAVPSYLSITEDGEVPKERLAQAVEQAGVDAVLISRLVKVDRETRIYPGTYVGPPYLGFYGFYSSAWMGFYDPPQIYSYDVVTFETSLFEAKTNQLLWSGTTETFSPRDLNKEAKEFAKVIVEALEKQGLVRKPA